MKNKGGRPREVKEPVSVSIRLEKATWEQMQAFSDRVGISRNKLVSNLIEVGLEDMEILEMIGAFGIHRLLQRLKDGVWSPRPLQETA